MAFFALAAGLIFSRTAGAETPLTPAEIMQKAVQRAESPASHAERPNYRYTKQTLLEDLDNACRLKDRTEKLYEVLVESGLSQLHLQKLNGQALTGAALKKQEAREQEERRKMTDAKPGKAGDERENFLTAEMVAKYKFTLLRQKEINGRDTYVLAFEPKSAKLPVKKITDRFLNQLAGTVWIDAQDFEITRAEIHLQTEVALWGGMVGTLRQCNYTLERTRLPDGVWFNSSSRGVFEGRKLLEPMFIRTHSESKDFRRVALATN